MKPPFELLAVSMLLVARLATAQDSLRNSTAGDAAAVQDLDSWSGDLTVFPEISKAITYGFSVGREIRPGIEFDMVEGYYFHANVNWMIVKDVSPGTSFSFEHGNSEEGNVTRNLVETYNYYEAD